MKKLLSSFTLIATALSMVGCSIFDIFDDSQSNDNADLAILGEIPDNQIWYITYSEVLLTPYDGFASNDTPFDVRIISNEYSDGIGKITFSGPLTTIGTNALRSDYRLRSIALPDSVTTIEESALENCSNLRSITIGRGLTEVGKRAFGGCGITEVHLREVEMWERVKFADHKSNPLHGRANLYLGNEPVEHYTFSEGATEVGDYQFYGCNSLRTITLPESIDHLGEKPFHHCYGLERFEGKFATADGSGLVVDDTLVAFAPLGRADYTLPEGIKAIESELFAEHLTLERITTCDGLETIGQEAFLLCYNLSEVNFGSGLKEIGEEAFWLCSKLEKMVLPEDIESVGEDALAGCAITSLTIPSSVKTLGMGAFSDCKELQSVKIEEGIETIPAILFGGCNKLIKIELPQSLRVIEERAFAGCRELGSVELPTGLQQIGSGAFSDCSSLMAIELPEGITAIEDNTFSLCSNLSFVALHDKITSIGYYAFSECRGLEGVEFGSGVQRIGAHAFQGCTKLQEITLPENIAEIGAGAFIGCKELKVVYCRRTTPPTATWNYDRWEAFDANAEGRFFVVPTGCVESYATAEGWKDYSESISAPVEG